MDGSLAPANLFEWHWPWVYSQDSPRKLVLKHRLKLFKKLCSLTLMPRCSWEACSWPVRERPFSTTPMAWRTCGMEHSKFADYSIQYRFDDEAVHRSRDLVA